MKNALLDMAQGASNAAASTVSAPVDAIAWLLRKAGVNIPAPVGGSDWMAAQGLTKQPKNALAGIAGESLGMVSPMMAAAKAPQIANALLKAGDNLANTQRIPMSAQRGAIVWHGSPHKFDRFDSSKIGTGEGAQAYGHGLYLAESPETAAFYREKLTSDGTLGGYKSANEARARVLMKHAARVEAVDPVRAARLRADAEAIIPGGALYKVDLPDSAIARMLDWDKPLSQQAPAVQQALADYSSLGGIDLSPGMTGKQVYDAFGAKVAKTKGYTPNEYGKVSRAAADDLRFVGMPGIRYLDGGSRGTGAGTSNFVVFPGEESLLRIIERNGILIR